MNHIFTYDTYFGYYNCGESYLIGQPTGDMLAVAVHDGLNHTSCQAARESTASPQAMDIYCSSKTGFAILNNAYMWILCLCGWELEHATSNKGISPFEEYTGHVRHSHDRLFCIVYFVPLLAFRSVSVSKWMRILKWFRIMLAQKKEHLL